jgi:integrase
MPAELDRWNQRRLSSGRTIPIDLSAAAEGPKEAAFDPASSYLAQLGEGSRRTMREALGKLARWASKGRQGAHDFPWHLLRIDQTRALRDRLIADLAPATANKHLAALRGVLKQCWQHGQMSDEAYSAAIDLPPAHGAPRRRPPRLGRPELQRLAQACRRAGGAAGARDEALLALLYGAHLRRSEAVALDLSDYQISSGQLTVGDPSSRNRRRLHANAHARRALERWIETRGREPGPLFNPVNKGGRIERRRLSEQAIYIACRKRAADAGLPPTSPEDLRRADRPKREDDLEDAPIPSFGPSTPA